MRMRVETHRIGQVQCSSMTLQKRFWSWRTEHIPTETWILVNTENITSLKVPKKPNFTVTLADFNCHANIAIVTSAKIDTQLAYTDMNT